MVFAYGYLEQPDFIGIRLFFVPATILMVVGYFDDRYSLPARVKLIGQIGVAILCWWLGFKISTLLYWQLPEMISLLVTIVWICGFINAFNLIDGLDGLSAGLTIVATLCMTVWFLFDKNFASAAAMLILAGACLGFLRYNFHPAQIFMGDVGSMFIGLTIAVLGMPSSKSVTITAVLVPLLAAGVPILDVFLAIWRRSVKHLLVKITGKSVTNGGVMSADTNHLHHRILSTVKDTPKTAIRIYFIGIIIAATAVIMMVFRGSAPGIGFVVVLLVFVVLIRRVATIEMWDSASLLLTGVKRPTQKMLLILLHPVYDLTVLVFAVYVSSLMFLPKVNYNMLMYTIAPVSLFVLISKNYRIFWLRADSGDYGHLVQVILLGFIFAFCLDYFFIYAATGSPFCQSQFSPILCLSGFLLLSFLFTTFLIVGQRLALRHLIFVFLHKIYMQGIPPGTHVPNTLIYGGGLCCRLLKNKMTGKINDNIYNIIGIIDDEAALRGQYIYGNKVYGGFDDLAAVCEKEQIEKIILTTELNEARVDKLKKFSIEHKIQLTRFSIGEELLT